uniref:Uncharacterized protein n=1 Tax=Spongospora subterranea TaxID=70186 RepID=A0A0H5QW59_9EUKA|eukprot:CRZ06228.1 hypothetical protein [Spongospora subterranea]
MTSLRGVGSVESDIPEFVLNGSTRARRLSIPGFLRKNPIKFRTSPKVVRKWIDKTLNIKKMLEAATATSPELVETAVVSSKSLTRADPEICVFSALTYLDAGDNNIPLHHLRYLPALVELHLHCNGISATTVADDMFPHLRILGLAYNQLGTSAIQNLSSIKELEELDLGCNEISSMPSNMDTFAALKKLSLRRNMLRNESVWSNLSKIPNLLVLDVSENGLKGVPTAFLRNPGGFDSLQFLDVSYNYVENESDLLGLAGFGSLEEVDVRGNPLIRPIQTGTELRTLYPVLYANLIEPCDLTAILYDADAFPNSKNGHLLKPIHESQDVSAHDANNAHYTDNTFMTSVKENFNNMSECPETALHSKLVDLEATGTFSDNAEVNVGYSLKALKVALDHPLIYHDKGNQRHYEVSNAAFERRRRPDSRAASGKVQTDRVKSLKTLKRFHVPRSTVPAHKKFEDELDLRLKKCMIVQKNPVSVPLRDPPEFLLRSKEEKDVQAILDLVISKLQK